MLNEGDDGEEPTLLWLIRNTENSQHPASSFLEPTAAPPRPALPLTAEIGMADSRDRHG